MMSSLTQIQDKALAELIRFSLQKSVAAIARQRSQCWLKTSQSQRSELVELASYASPLAPLNEQDKQALSGFFEQENIEEITTNLNHVLTWLWPEPCWDEEPHEFLKEFL